MDIIDPQIEDQAPSQWGARYERELTPFEYGKQTINESIGLIAKATGCVVGYIFLTAILGSFIEFGGIWWGITLSYIIALAGGIAYSAIRILVATELIEQYRKEYIQKQKKK